MPVLLRRGNLAWMYHMCMLAWFVPFIILPFLNVIAKTGLDEFGIMLPETEVMVWIGIALAILTSRLCCLAYSCVNSLLT